jgi:hypothetical protein
VCIVVHGVSNSTHYFGSTNILNDIFPTAALAAIARTGKHSVIHLALNEPSRRSLASSDPVVQFSPVNVPVVYISYGSSHLPSHAE